MQLVNYVKLSKKGIIKKYLIVIFGIFFGMLNAQNATQERINSKTVNSLNIHDLGGVTLKKGDVFKVEVIAFANEQEHIKTVLSGNKLEIFTPKEVKNSKAQVIVYLPNYAFSIEAKTVGGIETSTAIESKALSLNLDAIGGLSLDLNNEELNINAQSIGEMNLKGNTFQAKLKLNTIPSCNAKELKVKNLNLDLNSSLNSNFYVSENLSLKASSCISLNIYGSPKVISKIINTSSVKFK
jgi:hypothetical protein